MALKMQSDPLIDSLGDSVPGVIQDQKLKNCQYYVDVHGAVLATL